MLRENSFIPKLPRFFRDLTQLAFKFFFNKHHNFHLTPALVNLQLTFDETLIHHKTFSQLTLQAKPNSMNYTYFREKVICFEY